MVELLVVVGIVAVISTVVFSSQSTFNKTIILANTAYDVALSIRSAETYGLGGRGVSTGVANVGYGVYFDTDMKGGYILFADTDPAPNAGNCHGLPSNDAVALDAQPGDCVYNPRFDTLSTAYTLGNGVTISDFCYYNGSWSCPGGSTFASLAIVFARPNPTPLMSVNGSYSSAITQACLALTSPQGGSRFISVSRSGDINANAPSCP